MVREATQLVPRGFRDRLGAEADSHVRAEAAFRRVAESLGFLPVLVAPVGYAATFEGFGSAARGRIFSFPDRSGRELALTADSLVAVLRAVAGTDLLRAGQPVLAASSVPVARYRRRSRRAWTQAVACVFNQPDELAAELTLLRLWSELIEAYDLRLEFEFFDFGMLDRLAEDAGVEAARARVLLYWRRKAESATEHPGGPPADPDDAENSGGSEQAAGCAPNAEEHALLRRFQALREITHDDPSALLAAIEAAEPVLAARVRHAETVLRLTRSLGIEFSLATDWRRSFEYNEGLCFTVRDATTGEMLGDGGAYHRIAANQYGRLETCWSTVLLIELLGELLPSERLEQVHLFRKDESTDARQFLAGARTLRRAGFQVIEHWHPGRLRREIRRLPQDESVWFAVLGERENLSKKLILQNAGRIEVRREFGLPRAGQTGAER